jgi:hypothetical protein
MGGFVDPNLIADLEAERDRLRRAVQDALRGCTDEDWDFVEATLAAALRLGRDDA